MYREQVENFKVLLDTITPLVVITRRDNSGSIQNSSLKIQNFKTFIFKSSNYPISTLLTHSGFSTKCYRSSLNLRSLQPFEVTILSTKNYKKKNQDRFAFRIKNQDFLLTS